MPCWGLLRARWSPQHVIQHVGDRWGQCQGWRDKESPQHVELTRWGLLGPILRLRKRKKGVASQKTAPTCQNDMWGVVHGCKCKVGGGWWAKKVSNMLNWHIGGSELVVGGGTCANMSTVMCLVGWVLTKGDETRMSRGIVYHTQCKNFQIAHFCHETSWVRPVWWIWDFAQPPPYHTFLSHTMASKNRKLRHQQHQVLTAVESNPILLDMLEITTSPAWKVIYQ